MRTYAVSVMMPSGGYAEQVYSAPTPAKARASAWYDFIGAYECTFKAFLGISKVRRCDVPRDDGYAYVRRNYGVDPKIGKRVRLINEGSSTGLEGEIVYPGPSTAHVHVRLDGRDHNSIVHPMNVEMI